MGRAAGSYMNPPTEDTIRSALACLNPDDRDVWVMAGMAIRADWAQIARTMKG